MTAHVPGRKGERLLALSDEVNRIAGTLARLSIEQEGEAPQVVAQDSGSLSAKCIRDVLRARRVRSRFLPEDLFADPAWDMLLELLQAEVAHRRLAVSSLCQAAAVPPTTALRWLNILVKRGLVVRRDDPLDARRVFVELSQDTSVALRRYFAEIQSPSL